jgi:hypothetical protein
MRSPLPEVHSSIDALPVILINYPQVPYRNVRPRYDGTNHGGPTLLHNDTGRVDAVKPLPKISEENLVNWQHAIGAPVPSNQSFILSAPTVEGASTTLINLLTRLVDNTPPSKCIPIVEGSGISCTINNVDQLLYPLPPFEM